MRGLVMGAGTKRNKIALWQCVRYASVMISAPGSGLAHAVAALNRGDGAMAIALLMPVAASDPDPRLSLAKRHGKLETTRHWATQPIAC